MLGRAILALGSVQVTLAATCVPSLPGMYRLGAYFIEKNNVVETGIPLQVDEYLSSQGGSDWRLVDSSQYPNDYPFTLHHNELSALAYGQPWTILAASAVSNDTELTFVGNSYASTGAPVGPSIFCAVQPGRSDGLYEVVLTKDKLITYWSLCGSTIVYNATDAVDGACDHVQLILNPTE